MQTTSRQLTQKDVTSDDDSTTTHYTCNERVVLAGDSLWDCTLTEVTVTDICVTEFEDFKSINVYYDVDGVEGTEVEDSWTMYTDTGFESAISELLGYTVAFTEQGMQDNGIASLE
jgi:hypothetical protein